MSGAEASASSAVFVLEVRKPHQLRSEGSAEPVSSTQWAEPLGCQGDLNRAEVIRVWVCSQDEQGPV